MDPFGESEDLFADYTMDEENIFGRVENLDGSEEETGTDEDDEDDTSSLESDHDDNDVTVLPSPDDAIGSPQLSNFSASMQPTATQATWDWITDKTFTPVVEEFDDFTSGWKTTIPGDATELDIFEVVFNQEARKLCIEETNKYADQTGDATTKRWAKWTDITEADLMKFLALRILMGVNKKPEMKQYWSKDPLFHFPIVGKIMPQDRYFEILKNLHFSDNSDYVQGNRLFKIEGMWNLINSNFSNLLRPYQNLSVDESLILHKGRLFFRQWIPSKRSRFGIKTFSVVDQKTGFILNSIIYSGKDSGFVFSTKDYGYGGAIVLKLIQPYLENAHTIYADNYFTSPNLAKYLVQKKTYLCGTMRKGRKNAAVPPKKMTTGQTEVYSANGVMNEYWRDKKVVRMISTANPHQMTDVKKRNGTTVKKPLSVVNYNKNARGIDQGDMQMHFNTLKRKTRKWYKKLFFHLIDMCLYNAFKIFKSTHNDASSCPSYSTSYDKL